MRKKQTSPCCINGCAQNAVAKNRCGTHYQQLRRDTIRATNPMCAKDGCAEKSVMAGLCETHYRAYRAENPTRTRTTCAVAGCDRLTHAKALCERHYRQKKKDPSLFVETEKQRPEPPTKEQLDVLNAHRNDKSQPCRINGCQKKQHMVGLCNTHYENFHYYRKKGTYKTAGMYIWMQNYTRDGGEWA